KKKRQRSHGGVRNSKKQRVQEQIDAQVARELEEQLEREDQRRFEQIARDAEIARIHAEEELQIMLDGLDRNNETLEDFIPMGSKEEAERIKRKGLSLKQESAKKQKILEEVTEEAKSSDEVPGEKVKEMMQLVPIEEVNVEALQTHTQNFMHAPVEWKLYDSCGVHHVTSKDKVIFMLVEKDYPLRKGLALVMINYKLQVENYSQMENDLILKIYKITNSPRQQGSLGVIVYGYDGLPMQPVAPPSPDYVPGPEHPLSLDYVPGPEHPPSPVEIPYVSEPEYPEYLVPFDAEAPLVRANSPKPKLR
nr:hypothetical protein [Tanacetum cinerariifolium]